MHTTSVWVSFLRVAVSQVTADEPARPQLSLDGAQVGRVDSFITPQESYYIGDVRLRGYTLRLDGFASIHAPIAGGELITPPLFFKGSRLSMDFTSSAFGALRVEIQDADGKPLPGFTFDDSSELYGDTVARNALWKDNPDFDTLAGRPVRLRFVMKDADLYSMKFQGAK